MPPAPAGDGIFGPLGFGHERHCATLAAGMPPGSSKIDRAVSSRFALRTAHPLSILLDPSRSFLSSHSRFQEQAPCALSRNPDPFGPEDQTACPEKTGEDRNDHCGTDTPGAHFFTLGEQLARLIRKYPSPAFRRTRGSRLPGCPHSRDRPTCPKQAATRPRSVRDCP